MTKGVFTTKVNPEYNDLPERWYHFPRTYLNQVKECVSDWIVYYEPRRQDSSDSGRAGRQSYFATARITGIRSDPVQAKYFYADVEDFLEFEKSVPFREGTRFYESALKKEDGDVNKGSFGRAVRAVPDHEFDLILKAGFAPEIGQNDITIFSDEISGFEEEQPNFERPIIEQVVRRPF